jgi:hypothetical protein
MKRSSERILTTHIGSLPRPKDLWTMIDAKDRNQPYDSHALSERLKMAVAEIVRKQVEPASTYRPMASRARAASRITSWTASRGWRESIRSLTRGRRRRFRVRGLATEPGSQPRCFAGNAAP